MVKVRSTKEHRSIFDSLGPSNQTALGAFCTLAAARLTESTRRCATVVTNGSVSEVWPRASANYSPLANDDKR